MSLHPLLSLGLLFLSALALSGILKKVRLPSVTSYMILGIIAGPFFLDYVSSEIIDAAGLISTFVLCVISFSMGQNFSVSRMRDIGKNVLYISLVQSITAAVFTGLAVYSVTGNAFLSYALAAIAPATAPAAVVMVVRELRAKGKFTDTLLGVVAFSDVWGLMIFAVILAVLRGGGGFGSGIIHGIMEIGVSFLIGISLGYAFSFFSKFITASSEVIIYTLGFIMLNAGVALLLEASVLLSSMIMAGSLINFNRSGQRFFEAIRRVDAPFYLVFFVLAGASLEVDVLGSVAWVGILYIAGRMFGKLLGTWSASLALGAPAIYRKYLGIGLAPQAGVALGMAMILLSALPRDMYQYGEVVLSIVIATTVVYEVFGPFFTKYALVKSGETSPVD